MTLEEIQKELLNLEQIKYDDEIAHSTEDYIREKFIEAISLGFYDDLGIEYIKQCASEILKSNDIDFARWCA